MKRFLLVSILACCVIASPAIGADTSQGHVTPRKKGAPLGTKRDEVVAKGGTATKKLVSARSTTGRRRTSRTFSARSAEHSRGRKTASQRVHAVEQISPTPARYREIQRALAAKGYLKTRPSGMWDNDSRDVMRRFQQDQKLEANGKLTARGLTALGLGPKASRSSVMPPDSRIGPSAVVATKASPLR